MKESLIFDPSITGYKDDHDRIGAHLIDSQGDVISSGNGNADDIVNTTIRGLDVRSFGYAYDATGDNWDRLRSINGALAVDIQDVILEAAIEGSYEEDSPHVTADKGLFGLSIRIDNIAGANAALLAGTEGDYQGFFTDQKGQQYVRDVDAATLLASIDTELESQTTILNGMFDGWSVVANSAPAAINDSGSATIGTAIANRKEAWLFNNSKKKMYVGQSGITSATGFPFPPGSMYQLKIGPAATLHALGTQPTDQDLRVMQFSS